MFCGYFAVVSTEHFIVVDAVVVADDLKRSWNENKTKKDTVYMLLVGMNGETECKLGKNNVACAVLLLFWIHRRIEKPVVQTDGFIP